MGVKRTGGRARQLRVWGALLAIVGGVFIATPAAHAATSFPGEVCPPGCATLAADDAYTSVFNAKLTVSSTTGLLANDTGPNNTVVDLVDTDTVSFNGAVVTVHSDGSFTYTPDSSNPYSGIDSFDYWIWSSGDHDNTDFATAYVTLTPIVAADTYYTHVNTTKTVALPGVLTNDAGVDGTTLVGDSTSVHGGSVVLNEDGSFIYVPPHDFAGVDSFGYTVMDIDNDFTYPATVSVFVDSTPPVVALIAPSTVTLSTKVPVKWSATDSISGVKSYDVTAKSAPWNAGFGSTVLWKSATSSTSAVRGGTYGRTYCFSARATDRAGNRSGWIGRCTSVPLKATSLTYSSGWGSKTSSSYFGGGAHYTTTKNTKVSRTSVQAKRIWLVATKCGSCGAVQVRWNGVVTANVSLFSSTTKHKQLVAIASFSAAHSGTVTITTTSSSGKYVIVEGLAISRT